MSIKNEKRTPTLIEFMGFKDSDITEPQHDKIIKFLTTATDEQINSGAITDHILNKLLDKKYIVDIQKEVTLSNKFHYYGFIDILVRTANEIKNGKPFDSEFFCIEVKTKMPTENQLLRELEYYRTVLTRLSTEATQQYVHKYKYRGCEPYPYSTKWDSMYEFNQYFTYPRVGWYDENTGALESMYDAIRILAVGNVPKSDSYNSKNMQDLFDLGFTNADSSRIDKV